jgi:hypothetical protein
MFLQMRANLNPSKSGLRARRFPRADGAPVRELRATASIEPASPTDGRQGGMEDSASFIWAFAVIGGPILLALVLWFGIRHSRTKRATAATAPRSYGYPSGPATHDTPQGGPRPDSRASGRPGAGAT